MTTEEDLSQKVVNVLLDRNQSAADFQRNIQAVFDLMAEHDIPREQFTRLVSRGVARRGRQGARQ